MVINLQIQGSLNNNSIIIRNNIINRINHNNNIQGNNNINNHSNNKTSIKENREEKRTE